LPLVVSAREKRFGYCQTQATGVRVKTCTVEVFITGTLTHPTQIYQDNIGTPLGNPFTASTTTGLWSFYADNSRVDVKFSGGTPTITPAYTLSDWLFLDLGVGTDITVQSLSSALANIAQAGFIRLAAADTINWRNAANTGDIQLRIFQATGGYPADTLLFTDSPGTGAKGIMAGFFAQDGTTATIATAGALRLHSTDVINWRNNANTADISLSKTATDQINLSSFAALLLPAAAISASVNPAQSGVLRLASTDSICWRNGISTGDQCLSKNASDILAWPASISVNGETFNSAARSVITAFLPGNLTTTWTAGTWALSKPIIATSVRVQVKTAPVGCSPNAVVRIGDGVTNVDTPIVAAVSGGASAQFWGGGTLTISVLTAAAGCSTPPADANLIMEYRTN
jgi:hypothetical protein